MKQVDASFAQRAFTVKAGDLYQPSVIERARLALLQTGVFSGVSIVPGEKPNNGRVDLVIQVEERPAHAVSVAGTHHALFASGPFEVSRFVLFSSHLGSGGSVYRAERTYPLES